MIKLSKEMILNLYKKMVMYTGGSFGIREETLLDSALLAPFQTFFGDELYKTTLEKAARLGYGLVANHPFIDGNKRIGIYVMLVFLEVNNIFIDFSDDDIINLALKIADGTYKYDDVYDMLNRKLS